MKFKGGLLGFVLFFTIFLASLAYGFTASGGDIVVKSTTVGCQGSQLSGVDIGARFLMTFFQPGAFASAVDVSANIGYFELSDVCFPFGECGFFFGQILYCEQGSWKDPDLAEEYCTATNCEFIWMSGVTSGTQCCGDDGADDNSYYANASLSEAKYVLCQRCYEGNFATNTTLIGNGVLIGSGTERTCYHGNIVCSVSQALNGTSSNVYGWGHLDGQTCFFGNASCSNGDFGNSTNCELPCEGEWCCVTQVNYTDTQSCHDEEGCLFTNHDRNDAQSYCEASGNGCEPFVWFSNLNYCCGNDGVSDSFNDTGFENDCCFEGNFVEHNSSYQHMLCWNGDLYDCNNQSDLGFEIDVANCEEANDSGWYCAASGEPTYWQRGIPLGCEGCQDNDECAFGYCDSELEYGLTIDMFMCFNCTACNASLGNIACGDHNSSRCQYDCAGPGSEDCDDVEPMTCRGGTDIYCDMGCIARDRDDGEEYCTTDINNCEALTWINGGESFSFGGYDPGTSLGCCGDDSGEYLRNTSLAGTYYAACCNSPLSCVNQSNLCVETGTVQGDYVCSNGFWSRLPEHDNPRIHVHSRLDSQVAGYWNLDNDVKDSSYYGNHGTNNGATNVREGYAAGAFEFNGTGNYVNLNYGSGLNPSTHPHSFSMWVKAGATGTNRMFMSAGQEGGINNRFYIGINSGNWDMGIQDTPWGSGDISATTEWTHIAVTMNGSTAVLYVNAQEGRKINYSSYFFNRNIYLGNHDDDYYWLGKIDEVTIFNRTISEIEIEELYNGTAYTRNNLTCAPVNVSAGDGENLTFLFNWYKDENSLTALNMPFDSNVSVATSGAIRDYSDKDNHGTLGGGNQSRAPAYRTGDDCVSGGCYEFDGSTQYISLPTDSFSPGTTLSDITIEAWVYWKGWHGSASGIWGIINTPNNCHFEISTNTGTLRFRYNGNDLSAASVISPDEWTHVTVTHDRASNTSVMYVNGDIVGSLTQGAGTVTLSGAYSHTIGSSHYSETPVRWFNGLIDDFRMYNVTLTEEQIRANHIAGLNAHQPDVIDLSMTTKHEQWKCDVFVNDGYGESLRLYSDNLTIRNTPPIMGSLLLPAHESTTTNRRPAFEWEAASDDDGDPITYSIEIRREGACSLPDYCSVPVVTDSGISDLSYTPVQELDIATYRWNVTPHDGEAYGDVSETFEVTIQSLVNITLVNNTVNFSVIAPSMTKNTSTNDPHPFRIRNDGNIRCDILMNTTQLFSTRALNTSYFQAKAREIFLGSIDTDLSKMSWFNLSEVLTLVISDFEYSTGLDEVNVDIQIEVPREEPPGEKEAGIVFEAEAS
ncbi:MAG TPA: LamG domain-containing protein [Candidatus Woesearchaeota archaeon]|nr:LamG domain-containing protein [Candidatus Woesearchaeota archaeon]